MLHRFFGERLLRCRPSRTPCPSCRPLSPELISRRCSPLRNITNYSTSTNDDAANNLVKSRSEPQSSSQTISQLLQNVEEESRLGKRDVKIGQRLYERARRARNLLANLIKPGGLDSTCSGYGWTVMCPVEFTPSQDWCEVRTSPMNVLVPYQNPLLVILVSSVFTDDHDHAHRFAQAALKAVYGSAEKTLSELHILVAYVDRVSVPVAATNIIPDAVLCEGASGFSFFWTTQDKLTYDATEQDASPLSQLEDKTSELAIRLYENSNGNEHSAQYTQFKIPLTNTTFTNGRTRTMYLQKYAAEETQDETTGTKFMAPKDAGRLYLDGRIVKLNINGVHRHIELLDYSNRARTELTPWRSVAEVSGNVIKSLQGEDGSFPASIELEAAITKVAPSKHGKFEVWAEVATKQATPDGSVNAVASESSTFIKVVSGGGGWGEKRGLIALDPASVPDAKPWDTFDFNKMFTNSCEVGDKVRFLGIPINGIDTGDTKTSDTLLGAYGSSCVELHGYTSFGFGTSVSPETINTPLDKRQKGPIWSPVIFGHFGVLSQRMRYDRGVSTLHPADAATSTVDGSDHGTELPPYSHFSNGGTLETLTADGPAQDQSVEASAKGPAATKKGSSGLSFSWGPSKDSGPHAWSHLQSLSKRSLESPGPKRNLETKKSGANRQATRTKGSPKSASRGTKTTTNIIANSETSTLQNTPIIRHIESKQRSKVAKGTAVDVRRIQGGIEPDTRDSDSDSAANTGLESPEASPPIRLCYIDRDIANPEFTDWAIQERLVLDNLKANAPREAARRIRRQENNYAALFKNGEAKKGGKAE